MPPPDSDQSRWFAESVLPHDTVLRGWLQTRFGTQVDVEDIVQEAYARLLRVHAQGTVVSPKAFKNQISLRVHFNYRGRYLATFNPNESRMVYRISRPTVDIKSSYGFSRRLSAYLNVTNITATIDRGQEFGGGRAADALWMSPQFYFGIEARL